MGEVERLVAARPGNRPAVHDRVRDRGHLLGAGGQVGGVLLRGALVGHRLVCVLTVRCMQLEVAGFRRHVEIVAAAAACGACHGLYARPRGRMEEDLRRDRRRCTALARAVHLGVERDRVVDRSGADAEPLGRSRERRPASLMEA